MGRRTTETGRRMDRAERERFCLEYLRTLDAVQAGRAVGRENGFELLRDKGIMARLGKMREAGLPTRQDVVRRLGQLAFGQAGDADAFARARRGDLGELDLSEVAEMKLTDRGVEVKLVDRVRALAALWDLLEEGSDRAERFLRALEGADESEEP